MKKIYKLAITIPLAGMMSMGIIAPVSSFAATNNTAKIIGNSNSIQVHGVNTTPHDYPQSDKVPYKKTPESIDVSKIKYDLEHQEEIFESYKKDLFQNYESDENPQTSEKVYRQKAAKKIIDNIKNKNHESVYKIIKLQKVMRKDEGLEKLDVHVNKDLSSVVEAIIYCWNQPPETTYLNNALQQAAIKKFHLRYTSTKELEEVDLGEYRSHIDTIGMILEEMRGETYNFLKNKGLKEITLFRGMKSPVKMNENAVDVTKLAALSSWTVLKDVSDSFGMTPKLNLYPYILVKNIPIDRILSFMGTGIGTGYEYEFVVLGGRYPKDEFFILPGTRIGTEIIIQSIAKQVEKSCLSTPDVILQEAYGKYSKIISKQLHEIAEIPNITADIVREKLYFSLTKEGLNSSTARLISDDIKDRIRKEQY